MKTELAFRQEQFTRLCDKLNIAQEERTIDNLLSIACEYEDNMKSVGVFDSAYSHFSMKMSDVYRAAQLLEHIQTLEK